MGNLYAPRTLQPKKLLVRGDANDALAIGFNLHEASRWIYGDGAFGLRLAAWIARKAV